MSDISQYEGSFAVIDSAVNMQEMAEENLGGGGFTLSDLRMVVFPGAGDDRFYVKSAAGEERAERITGVVLGQKAQRRFYRQPYVSGGNNPPDCSSEDGITGQWIAELDDMSKENGRLFFYDANGVDWNFGGACNGCPMAEFGSIMKVNPSRESRGQACTESRLLMVQQPDRYRPLLFRIPPTALSDWRAFGNQLFDRGLLLSQVVVSFSLKAASGETARLVTEIVGVLPKETRDVLKSGAPNLRQLAPATAPVDVLPAPAEDPLPF